MRRRRALAALAASTAAAPVAGYAQALPGRIGSGSVEANAQGFYAEDGGFFRNAGVDAEITVLKSGPAIAAAVVGGDLVVLRDGPIHSAKDLEGRGVGGQSIGTTAQLAILSASTPPPCRTRS